MRRAGRGPIRDQADWDKAVDDADKGLDLGGFLPERLGAERCLDPQLMAVLLVLRRRLVAETGLHTALEYMLVDSAVLAYFQQLFPLLHRANRLMPRNLQALHELKLPPQPNVTIGRPAQVNVAQQQVNAIPRSEGRRTEDADKQGRRRRP